jgi:tetratricopeptide (TPR) repeat protein
MSAERRYRWILGGLLAAGFVVRLAYVAVQPPTDPAFSRPVLDGAYYLEWATALASGSAGPEGAYYMAPLYPLLLAAFLRLFGVSFALLYVVQHAIVVAAAAILATVTRRFAGDRAALAAAAFALLYHPLMFFASRPLGEPVPLLLLAAALLPPVPASVASSAVAGAAIGAASLGRPNLLLVSMLWAGVEAYGRRWRRAVAILGGTSALLAPVMVRNFVASGHLVPLSANSGVVLYLGNGPDAYGVMSSIPGFTGSLTTQRDEATAFARSRSGMELDAVQADRWLAREAVRLRLQDPLGTVALLGRKLAFTVANAEQGLDYLPRTDANPLRFATPLPFAVLLGLAGAGIATAGVRGSGGLRTWLAILASAATPIVFYVSSRHRLPLAFLLAIPAGAGFSALVDALGERPRKRLARGLAVGLACTLVSFAVPTRALEAAEDANALCDRAAALFRAGDFAGSERAAREAAERNPLSARARFSIGAALEAGGRAAEAETEYRRVLDIDPRQPEAAANLAGILVRKGKPSDAIPILRLALEAYGRHKTCWQNLVVALATSGDLPSARAAADEAKRAGVRLDPGLIRSIGGRP